MKTRKINESFDCQKCGKAVPPHTGSCRNHCPFCLFSLHVDDKIPGDRMSECISLMIPTSVEYSGKKGYSILHECTVCGHKQKNRTAPDDDLDAIISLMQPNA